MSESPRVIHDPVYGTVYPDRLEWLIIRSLPVQRLKGIQQLALVDTVYPGAIHTRFEHSIGTMHMAGLIASHLGLEDLSIRKARLAGLLHDVGHPAFSHAVELVLARNPDLQPLIDEKPMKSHEQFTEKAVLAHRFGEEACRIAEDELGPGIFDEVAELIRGGRPPLGQIISGDMDADRIDFLLRDSHHSGVNLGLVDLDQIVLSLDVRDSKIILAGDGDYRQDLSITAAESMLVARAHHYSALIHHPRVQSARAMLLFAIESVLDRINPDEARSKVLRFFTEFTDPDLLEFLRREGDDGVRAILDRLRGGLTYSLLARFDHRTLPPETRMALATIARNGRMRKIFESGLMKKYSVLVDLSTGSGVPRSARTADGFLYDESALAAGLIRSLTRQITLSFFSAVQIPTTSTGSASFIVDAGEPTAAASPASSAMPQTKSANTQFSSPSQLETSQIAHLSLKDVQALASKLLSFIRSESYLPIDGLLLLFHGLHSMLSETFGARVLVPRIRNITWIYGTVRSLSGIDGLSGLFDYRFHTDFGFPYSERLFEDLQILVAMGMVYQDLRHYERKGRWTQRYEYMLTAEGFAYSGLIVRAYPKETEAVRHYLLMEKHNIPYDRVSLLEKMYTEGRIAP